MCWFFLFSHSRWHTPEYTHASFSCDLRTRSIHNLHIRKKDTPFCNLCFSGSINIFWQLYIAQQENKFESKCRDENSYFIKQISKKIILTTFFLSFFINASISSGTAPWLLNICVKLSWLCEVLTVPNFISLLVIIIIILKMRYICIFPFEFF